MAMIRVLNENNKVVDELFFEKEYIDKIKSITGSYKEYDIEEKFELSSPSQSGPPIVEKYTYVTGMLTDMKDIMEPNLNDEEFWKRLATNEGIEKPQSLIFTISDKNKELLSEFVDPKLTNSLQYIKSIGALAMYLNVLGVPALIGQFIANKLEEATENIKSKLEARKLMADMIGMKNYRKFDTEEELKEYLDKEIITYEVVLEAVKKYFPDSAILTAPQRLQREYEESYLPAKAEYEKQRIEYEKKAAEYEKRIAEKK